MKRETIPVNKKDLYRIRERLIAKIERQQRILDHTTGSAVFQDRPNKIKDVYFHRGIFRLREEKILVGLVEKALGIDERFQAITLEGKWMQS